MMMSNLVVFFRQRFPIVGVLFIAITTASTTSGLYHYKPSPHTIFLTLLFSINFVAFLLRQRITDEFKDKLHDAIYFPERPFIKGLITARSLIILGVLAFIVEIGTVFVAGGVESLLWYTPVLLYSVLMMKEFFCGTWLEKHFTIYFILHELIFIFYALWISYFFHPATHWILFAWIIFFVCILVSIEIGRKFSLRRDPHGQVVQDTYSAVWGRNNTIIILQLIILTSGIALSYAERTLIFAIFSSIAVFVLHLNRVRTDTFIQGMIVTHALMLVVTGFFV